MSVHRSLAALALVFMAACGSEPRETAAPNPSDPAPTIISTSAVLPPLSEAFDCVRETGGVLISAHRGGPAPGYPENGLETLKRSFQWTPLLEIDVAESRDGVLFLMHDRTLTRTTTGSGAVADTPWSDIQRLRLVDSDGKATDFRPPELTEALVWARDTGAILQLDRKATTSFRNIIRTVRAVGAENNVILITYSDREAAQVARLAPELMMTASARGGRDLDRLAADGVDPRKVIAWTGTGAPDPAAWNRLNKARVEAAFGTLGRPGERLDDEYKAGDYQKLVADGLIVIGTDRAQDVADMLSEDNLAIQRCLRGG